MTNKTNFSLIISKLQIVVAGLLFIVMLFLCGSYINIKMNGKTSSLPELSENDINLILKTAASESVNNYDDLIEPVFIGIKNGDSKICSSFDAEARKSFETLVYNQLFKLFSGYSEKKEFNSDDEKLKYIESLKTSERFVLLSFLVDIPATTILPCISQNFDIKDSAMYFDVNYLFLLPDNENNVYGVSVSSDMEINVIYPETPVVFNNSIVESYDIGEGYSRFEFDDHHILSPVMTSSAYVNKVRITPYTKLYGKELTSEFVDRLFEVFSINKNLVKSFSSKNYSEMFYVDDMFELFLDDSGVVEFESSDYNVGVGLDHFLGYLPLDTGEYTFYDKMFAIKNLVNLIVDKETLNNYSISAVEYDNNSDVLSVYLKSFVNGGAVTSDAYDAVFKICANNLVYVKLYAVICENFDEKTVLMPQKYASILALDKNEMNKKTSVVPVLVSNENYNLYSFGWGVFIDDREVVEVAHR